MSSALALNHFLCKQETSCCRSLVASFAENYTEERKSNGKAFFVDWQGRKAVSQGLVI